MPESISAEHPWKDQQYVGTGPPYDLLAYTPSSSLSFASPFS